MGDSPENKTTAGVPVDDAISPQAAQLAQPTHLRSCILCRQRKVKCDRRQPCSNCVRAGTNCVHPPGAGRAAKRSRQAVDTKVLDRLSQLETTIRRLQQQAKEHKASTPASEQDSSIGPRAQGNRCVVDDAVQVTEAELGRLVIEESQSRYVSNIMWADLTGEIEQLRGMFLDSSPQDDESAQLDENSPSHDDNQDDLMSSNTNAALFRYRSLSHSLRDLHPPTELSMKLFQLFSDNVLPLVRIFHTTSLIRLFWGAAATTNTLDKETEALLFAIYYSAVISIDPIQCQNITGQPRPVLVERFRFATEQALARANLLSTHSTLLLQAAILYISVLRSDDGTRTVWSLIALATHLARSMGLHRDGTAFNLPPFETEMRRRIWHQVCLLDHRSTEYHGYEPLVLERSAFDTHWPLNVNDKDLASDMTEFPPEREGATDMTLVQVRCYALEINWKMKRASRAPFQTRVKIMDEHDKWVEKYVERCDPAQPLHYLAKEICYMASERVRSLAYYTELKTRKHKADADALHERTAGGSNHETYEDEWDNQTLRDHIFSSTVRIMKRIDDIMQNSRLDPWVWHLQTYVQWHTLALALSEICVRPPSPECDAVWNYATRIYDKWLLVKFRDSGERGDNVVKPIGQLIARARRVREMQQQQRQGQQPHHQTQQPTPTLATTEWIISQQKVPYTTPPNIQTPPNFPSLDAMPMSTGPLQPALPVSGITMPSSDASQADPLMYDIGDFDTFLEMMPAGLHNEWFESMAQGNPMNPSSNYSM
ncbi:hypothetical protein NPX13_g5538 [Xylaria arbuscula]|uniref:Zn(2)-C6 fungal-type domain-containing protein n=1 Tax=Xylaria arbuscula TaxID=114810 RepID=A0A9W8TKW8_9PEZI|nr:hypothetical protein NPX13_g5538 [Xylaria arbuscula]